MTKHVLFEIGLEELPAGYVDDAEKQLADNTAKWLKDLRISYEAITSFSTPRRLAVLIQGMAEEQTTIEEEVKGPAVKIAKDSEGNWTKAAIGFTKGQGKTVEDIYTKEIKGTTYIFVKKHIEGQQTAMLLPGFKAIIESITFAKNMHWGEEKIRYARPIRWLVAMYGEKIIPFEIAHVQTSNITYGHRFLGEKIVLANPTNYQHQLKKNFVIADAKEREQLIVDGIQRLETEKDIRISLDATLLNEVRNLVEYPTVFIGSFESKFLELPSEVLITSMKEHQRYFSVKSADGKLLPRFVGVRNGDDYAIEQVVKGNEKVLYARLSDAQFFYEEDQKHTIEYYLDKLGRVVFQEKLGTVSDKTNRVVQISRILSAQFSLDEATTSLALRTAAICKFDLVTNMVNEFTELQGIIGEKYASVFGEDAAVAIAIREHYLPVQSNGKLPESLIGAIVSVADKLDTIVGCVSVGLTPTGSQDPYALRRQAAGILKIMEDNHWDIPLETLLADTQALYRTTEIDQDDPETVTNKLLRFFQLRATYLLKEWQIEQDVIQSVLNKEIGVFDYTLAKARVLSTKRNDNQFKYVQEALVRILNLAGKAETSAVDPAAFKTDSEATLFRTYEVVQEKFNLLNQEQKASEALLCLGELAEPIHQFFDHNMVMADDKQLRNNRLALVKNISILINDYADLTVIEWKQHF